MLEKQQYHPHFKTTNSTISDNLAINFPIHTELADYLSPAENIAEHLTPWFHFKGLTQDQILPELQQIFIMLRTRTTHDFSSYKLNTICRRIEKQMSAHHIHALNEYVRLLRDHPREIDNLFKDLLIGVTSFFRDTEAFELLKQMLINLLKSKPPEYYLRVWIPACSTGEEAYSIAIIIHECLEEIQLNHKVKIFSTDIDLSALETARAGIYPAIISNDITPIRLKKYFLKEKNNYRIKNEIREMVVFGIQNITKDPPFTKLDLICCRNLLIYFNAELQKKILPLFHYSLKSRGILFLGTSEAIASFADLFSLAVKKWKIFERKNVTSTARAIVNFPTATGATYLSVQPTVKSIMDGKSDLKTSLKKIATDNDIKPETTLTEYDSIAKMTKKIASLEKELKHTKENLQTTIEELESSNEELQSTNEELQSINEEIETSKEELQSLNEELVISNTELQKRIEKIASVSDDISNLFNSTEVAAIFLNTHMHIKHFTPKAQNLIHIIQSDIGRPLRHFATNIKYDYLIENAEEVLNTLISKIITVQSKDNKYYSIKILPYRTLYNVIDGVVITFTDISIYKETEIKMKSVNDSLSHVLSYHETILDCLREPILVLNMDLEVMSANKSFYQYFHLSSETTLGQYVYDLAHKQWNMPKLRELLNNVVSNDILFENFKVEHEFPIIGKKKLILNARKIFHQYHGMDTLFLAIDEE